GTNDAWLWVAVVEPIHYRILDVHISKHRNTMLVAESFLKSLVNLYGKHIVYSALPCSINSAWSGTEQHITTRTAQQISKSRNYYTITSDT
ncbi:MAG TPA: hypothetical protein VFI70_08610, partial [Nitrososphaeraceae archaeon]|nr:hypothetical protein [Nitrososphaeraceae archaeon]